MAIVRKMTDEEIANLPKEQEQKIEMSLEEKVERLEEQNQMLIDCILEMAEIVYE